LLVGGNPARGTYESHMEIYSPAYLFNPDSTPAVRPVISDIGTGVYTFGNTFQVVTPDAADIASVVLVRPGAPTHAFDMDQRLVGLSYTAGQGLLNVTAPPNGNIAPPGYYMLFILNSAGVPSVASFVRLQPAPPNQAPTASIATPGSNVVVNPGQSVAFSGSGSDPDGTIAAYAWTFPGGTPGSSTLATPGDVTYSTPGAYVATLSVSDNGGLASPPATRTVSVADFSMSAGPGSQSVVAGGSANFAASVTAVNGFTGTVDFTVTGLPSGATASFTPASISSSGSTTLNVATTAATAPGTYALSIRGTSGPLVRSVPVTLVVNTNGDFSISVSPISRTVQNGANTTYAVTVIASQGFSGTVNLSVSGLPKFVTASFSPAALAQPGTSVLTLSTKKQTKTGSTTLTVQGASGSLVHTAGITLIVQ